MREREIKKEETFWAGRLPVFYTEMGGVEAVVARGAKKVVGNEQALQSV